MTDTNHDYGLEMRLHQLEPDLHRRYTDAVVALRNGLTHYQTNFPAYTDHSILHSMTVIDFCNRLIGGRIDRLNEDEIFILLMSCLLHDTGMGITMQSYEQFSSRVDFGSYFETHSREDLPAVIRAFHHEFSGLFIRKYADLFELPSPEHEQAIVQVARGHRVTDLMDEKEYPADFRVPDGNTVCLPYLAAMIRLADEIDVSAARNPLLLYDIDALKNESDVLEFKRHRAIRRLDILDPAFVLEVSTAEEKVMEQIRILVRKMQRTLTYCRAVVNERTPYTITQEKVLIHELDVSCKAAP